MRVTAVTVTYGKRVGLLTQVLDAAKAEGISEAVVIDNGSSDPICEILEARYGDWAFVHQMAGNMGSAIGFKVGLEDALQRGAEYLLLLDDDNLLRAGTLDLLRNALQSKADLIGLDRVAVFGYRRSHQAINIFHRATGSTRRKKSTFRDFHVLDIPLKILSRFSSPLQESPAVFDRTVPVEFGPYGGMFIHRAVIGRIGLPDDRFVLYEDDTEFTNRITKAGGCLWIATDAEIEDLERSWNTEGERKSSFTTWLDGSSDLRIFYAFRNGAYSDFHCFGGRREVVFLNMLVFMSMLAMVAVVKRRGSRFVLLCRALKAGVFGELGPSAMFPLSHEVQKSHLSASIS